MKSQSKALMRKIVVRLLAAVCTIGLLVGVGVLVAVKRQTISRNEAACCSNLRQIAYGCALYADDNGGNFPGSLKDMCFTYVDAPIVFSCPSAPSEYRDFYGGKVGFHSSSYVLVSGLKATMPSDTILAYDKSVENHKREGRNAAFVDGHVEWMREEEFQKRLKKQRAELGISE